MCAMQIQYDEQTTLLNGSLKQLGHPSPPNHRRAQPRLTRGRPPQGNHLLRQLKARGDSHNLPALLHNPGLTSDTHSSST